MTTAEIERRMRRASARAINQLMDKVAADAIPETPLLTGELRASEVYPANDLNGHHTASERHLEAMVSFNTVYAAAQHEGVMTYERDGDLIHWVVMNHTEPGTKTHYLEDPFKAMIPRVEPFIAASVRRELGA